MSRDWQLCAEVAGWLVGAWGVQIFGCGCKVPDRPAAFIPLLSFVVRLTTARLLAVVAIVGAHWAYVAATVAWYAGNLPYERGLGSAAALAMALCILPALRYSFIVAIFGTSFERSVDFHKFIGLAAVALTWIHGLWMFVYYCQQGQCLFVFDMVCVFHVLVCVNSCACLYACVRARVGGCACA